MGSTSERLPSFKGPRDLSLSNRGSGGTAAASSSQQPPRPKRVYTPNIPPKRERGSIATTTAAVSNPPVPSTSTATAEGPRGRSDRGRGNDRGGRGRGGKRRPELQQMASIFSGGVGDPSETRKAYSAHYRSEGGGGGRYRSSGSEGRARLSTMNRSALNSIIKQEELDESSAKIFGAEEKFEKEDEEDTNPENPNVPVILPLLNYVPHLFAPAAPALDLLESEREVKAKIDLEDENQAEIAGPSTASSMNALVRIKQEVLDDEEPESSTSLVKIKQEKIDESGDVETAEKTLRNAFLQMSLTPTSFAGTLRGSDKNGTLAFFQLPDQLPLLKGSLKDSTDQPSSNSSERQGSSELVSDIDDLPEGLLGRFQVMSSGRTRFVMGENVFDVEPGQPVGFLQELFCLDLDKNILTNLGPVDRKFVVFPDLESLFRDSK